MKNKRKETSYEDDGILKVDLPKADTVLVLGIISILTCFILGVVGIVLGIVAKNLSKKSMELYELAPELYTKSSYKNLKAGRVCATIGIILSAVFLGFAFIYYALKGAILTIF
jgi:hypothetical protein